MAAVIFYPLAPMKKEVLDVDLVHAGIMEQELLFAQVFCPSPMLTSNNYIMIHLLY